MPELAVSSYSLREQLGPTSLTFTDPAGRQRTLGEEFPKLLELADFPARASLAFGVRAVEVVAFQFHGLHDPQIDAFGAAARTAGVDLLNAAVDTGDLLAVDPATRAADVAELKDWIARFAGIGSRFVRVNPGSPFHAADDDHPPAHLVEALSELGAYADEHGTRLLVENHGGPSSDPVWMNALLDAVGPEHLGLLLDLGNFDALTGAVLAAMFADPPPAEPFAGLDLTSLYAGIDALAGRAELVHVKAHEVGADGAVGPIDLRLALDILDRHHYAGPLTIEYEGTGGDPWANTRRVLDLTTEVVAR